jgi:hypothetical protein
MVVDFVIMLFSIVESSGWAFGICFSISLFFTSTTLVATLFECEYKAYRTYYTRQLHLKDEQIVAFKLPLQVFIVACVATALIVFDVLVHGFVFRYLLLASGITAYYVASCVPLNWWFIRRLKKGKHLDALHGIATLAVFAFPGTVLLYTLASAFTWRLSAGSRVKRFF